MHAHDVRVHAYNAIRSFKGGESADGKIFKEVAAGDIGSLHVRTTGLRDSKKGQNGHDHVVSGRLQTQ